MVDIDSVRNAAGTARNKVARLSLDNGVLDQIEKGEWDRDLSSEPLRDHLMAVLERIGEQARQGRIALDRGRESSPEFVPSAVDPEGLIPRLPFNRKERYFTGTVLPAIVTCDDFAHLGRLLKLCGLDPSLSFGPCRYPQVQFFTEYSFDESVFLRDDIQLFADRPPVAAVPDIVILGPNWLLTVEAKMYHHPSAASLAEQVSLQQQLVDYWRIKFAIPHGNAAHVVLLPAQMTKAAKKLPNRVITWEQLERAYSDVAPTYWLDVLRLANEADLVNHKVTAKAFGVNAHGHLTGAQIAAGELEDPVTGRHFTTMGRKGGLSGPALAKDIASGGWQSVPYEVRFAGEPNGNWFPIAEFYALISEDM